MTCGEKILMKENLKKKLFHENGDIEKLYSITILAENLFTLQCYFMK